MPLPPPLEVHLPFKPASELQLRRNVGFVYLMTVPDDSELLGSRASIASSQDQVVAAWTSLKVALRRTGFRFCGSLGSAPI